MSHHALTNHDFNKYFYTPRTLFTMGLMIVVLNIYAFRWCEELTEHTKPYFYDENHPDVFEKFRWPIFIMCFTVIGFASAHFPDTWVKRPHPVFWRVLLGVMLCYTTFMTLVFMLPIDQARWIFKIFHPSFGVPLPEKNYADDCRVFTPENPDSSMANISDAVFDVHFIAHLGGWWFKMMIMRDTKIAWIISGSFELIEISFRHWLPNFHECWWDHVSNYVPLNHFCACRCSLTFLAATCGELSLEP